MNNFIKWDVTDFAHKALENSNFGSFNLTFQDGLSVELHGKIDLVLTFERYYSVRVSDESVLLKYSDYMIDSDLEGLFFYIVQESSFIENMSSLSFDFFADGGRDGIMHFCIFCGDKCIEILSDMYPVAGSTR